MDNNTVLENQETTSLKLHEITTELLTEELQAEIAGYTEHISNLFQDYPKRDALRNYLPSDETRTTAIQGQGYDLISALRDGILFGHLLALVKPGSIDLKKLDSSIDLAAWQRFISKKTVLEEVESTKVVDTETSSIIYRVTSNLQLVLSSAKEAGIIVVNVGPRDILQGKVDLVLGLLWQIIRSHLLSEINLNSRPELVRLLDRDSGETLPQLLNLSSEKLLLRWVNHHLKSSNKVMNNFSQVSDGIIYSNLFRKIAPVEFQNQVEQLCVEAEKVQGIARAQLLLEAAELLNCRRFVTAKDMCSGHARLNLGFVATLFNKHIGIELPSEEEIKQLKRQLHEQEVELQGFKNREKERETLLIELQRQVEEKRAKSLEQEVLVTNLSQEKEQLVKSFDVAKQDQEWLSKTKQELEKRVESLTNLLESTQAVESRVHDGLSSLLQSLTAETHNDKSTLAMFEKLKTLLKEMAEQLEEDQEKITSLTDKIEKNKVINDAIANKVVEYADAIISQPKTKKDGWKGLLAWFRRNDKE